MSSSDHFLNPTTIKNKPSNYVLPHHGIFPILPTSWVPYAELMRLDRPAGYYAYHWHYTIGIAFAACISEPPLLSVLLTAIYYGCAVVVLRGVSCFWNDNLDQEFDRKVARCRNRPIARGGVTNLQGQNLTAVQIVIGVIMVLPLRKESTLHIAFIVAVRGIYPLGKRFTDFPQLILGFGLSYPIFLCCATLDVNIIPLSERYFLPALCLFIAGALWTTVFDTIYAHQDILQA